MDLIKSLFPNLNELNEDLVIPYWPINQRPWELLDPDNSLSLKNQINIKNNFDHFCDINEKFIDSKISIDLSTGPIFIHDSAIIADYVAIEGPCYIGKNTEIRHSAYIRQGSWICQDVVIGNSSEIKNSLLLPNSKTPHFNYVGDSILGVGVNLGAGTKLSNVRNDKKNIRINVGNDDFLHTNLKKFGALIGDFSQLGCNTVTNPGTVINPNTNIPPNSVISGWQHFMSLES